MIASLGIENLKCHKALSLSLAPLTLLTGFNAGGKSTAVQGALLLAQALRSSPRSRWISLNGPLTRIGTVSDAINETSKSREMTLVVESEEVGIAWHLDCEERTSIAALPIVSVSIKHSTGTFISPIDGDDLLEDLLPIGTKAASILDLVGALRTIVFIGATRVGADEIFGAPEMGQPIHADVGTCGEFAPWWFAQCSDDEVEEDRRLSTEAGTTLRRQVGAWGDQLFPGFEAAANSLLKTGLVQLQLRTRITEDWRRPSNVGFGLSYAFPILVAGLLAKPNQILVIDSPEAHLHPRAQSRMGEFLAAIARSGVRVIVETHSDHVLNGIRLAVIKKTIEPEMAAIYFFGDLGQSDHSPTESLVRALHIDSNGGISNWPDGFFDQAEKDMAALAGWS